MAVASAATECRTDAAASVGPPQRFGRNAERARWPKARARPLSAAAAAAKRYAVSVAASVFAGGTTISRRYARVVSGKAHDDLGRPWKSHPPLTITYYDATGKYFLSSLHIITVIAYEINRLAVVPIKLFIIYFFFVFH